MDRSEEAFKRGAVALLDVNVLIALHEPDHIHHEEAADGMLHNAVKGWASGPLTQNGCGRALCQPGYRNPVPAQAALAHSCSQAHHRFWADDLSLLDPACVNHAHVHGHRQLTDLYLLALAVRHGGRFVTFDAMIPLSAVQGATARHLVTL